MSTSIQSKWTRLVGAILAGTLLSFGSLAWYRGHQARLDAVDRQLQERLNVLISAFRPLPGEGLEAVTRPRFSSRARSLFEEEAFYYVLWKSEGQVQAKSEGAPSLIEPPDRPSQGLRTREAFRERWQLTPTGRCFLVGKDLKAERAQGWRDLQVLGASGLGILGLGWGVAWAFSRRWVRSLRALGHTAKAIASGDLSQRAPLPASEDELHEVVQVLNDTFARLDEAFQREKRFTADAAHELKTPLSTILIEAQSAQKYPHSQEEWLESFAEIEKASKRMRRLLESLMELSRWDAGAAALKMEDVPLRELLQESVERLRRDAPELGFELELGEVHGRGDALRLQQVFTNLLQNAVHYTPPRGRIRVNLATQSGAIVVSIHNTGSFIEAEHLPRLFDRFYRTDQARARGTGGMGLGLAISKAIVDAHGGRIEVISDRDSGTQFTVTLPQRGVL